MKCGSQGCDRLAYARWVAILQDGRVTPTMVQTTYLLCEEHDAWYQSLAGYTTFRIGLLAEARASVALDGDTFSVEHHEGYADRYCGPHCQARRGACTGCGSVERDQVNDLCLLCRDEEEAAHSWCPK